MIEPPKKYFRLYPGNEVRLMNAYFVTCTDYITDDDGNVTEIHCTYDPETKSGSGFTGRKVKGTIQWVCAETAERAEVRLYENIVDEEKGVYNEDGTINVNPNSLTILENCYVEPALAEAKPMDSFQFVRQGYFCVDAVEHPKKDQKPQIQEEDLLFDKSFTCPVCDEEFHSKMVRTGKVKLLSADSDLRPKYQMVDSLKYDALVCPHCGYAALSRFFKFMLPAQAKMIRENITANFKGIDTSASTYSYDDAIMRHQLALANAVVKKAKTSEKAYTCLKMAWLYRIKKAGVRIAQKCL